MWAGIRWQAASPDNSRDSGGFDSPCGQSIIQPLMASIGELKADGKFWGNACADGFR